MKTHKLLIIAVAVSLSGTTTAQTFNTISDTRPRYKVEQSIVEKTKEASPESDTSYTHTHTQAYLADSLSASKSILAPYVHSPLGRKLVITSDYGWRKAPFNPNKTTFHSGLDLRARHEPVYAMLPGEVLRTGYDDRSGNYVTLEHGNITVSYCHLSYIGIAKGTQVYAGQPLGISGNTGRSQAEHLHLTVKANNKTISAKSLIEIPSFVISVADSNATLVEAKLSGNLLCMSMSSLKVHSLSSLHLWTRSCNSAPIV